MDIDIDIYPCTIVADRYNGSFSGAPWIAYRLSYFELPDELDAGDGECHDYWAKEDKSLIGFGQTPQEAYNDLKKKVKAFQDNMLTERQAESHCQPFIEAGYELVPRTKTFKITATTRRLPLEMERKMIEIGYVFYVVIHDEFGGTTLIPSQAHFPNR